MLSYREECELAAKAAGMPVVWRRFGFGEEWCVPDDRLGGLRPWRPRDDDGDAFRLQSALRMTVAHEPSRGGWSVGAVVGGEYRWLSHGDDLRLAIFKAAVTIGQSMP